LFSYLFNHACHREIPTTRRLSKVTALPAMKKE